MKGDTDSHKELDSDEKRDGVKLYSSKKKGVIIGLVVLVLGIIGVIFSLVYLLPVGATYDYILSLILSICICVSGIILMIIGGMGRLPRMKYHLYMAILMYAMAGINWLLFFTDPVALVIGVLATILGTYCIFDYLEGREGENTLATAKGYIVAGGFLIAVGSSLTTFCIIGLHSASDTLIALEIVGIGSGFMVLLLGINWIYYGIIQHKKAKAPKVEAK